MVAAVVVLLWLFVFVFGVGVDYGVVGWGDRGAVVYKVSGEKSMTSCSRLDGA